MLSEGSVRRQCKEERKLKGEKREQERGSKEKTEWVTQKGKF